MKWTKMSHQKGTEMNRNVPTRVQLTKISQNRENPDTKMNQIG